MPKRYLFIFLLFCIATAVAQPFYYKLKASHLELPENNYLYVRYEAGGNTFTDSFLFTVKSRVFIKKLAQPVAAALFTKANAAGSLSVFLANNTITVSLKNNTITIQDASGLQPLYQNLTQNDRVRPSYFPLYGTLTQKKDTAGLEQLSLIFDSLRLNDIAVAKEYLKQKPNSLLSLQAFLRYASFSADYAAAESLFLKLPVWARKSPDGQNVTAKINGAKSAKVNTKAPVFKTTGLSGETIMQKNYSGKYLLLDFWASWCGPCRKEHPALKKLYEQFGGEKFEIISISLDDRKESWVTAVTADALPWVNASDLKGFQAPAALQFGVQAIPANFLIDPNGIIIAKNGTPEELAAILKKILN
jgi:thiol-disulfide isomerase/thioredoxin